MNRFSRRSFIGLSGGLFLLNTADVAALSRARKPKLSFSTLGCPDWSLDQIINFAAKNDYSGIEFRGIQREIDLTKTPAFQNREAVKDTVKKIRDKNLRIVGFGSSSAMHHREPADRNKAMDEAKRYIDLAEVAGCPYVRVFPDKLPAGTPVDETLDLITEGLTTLGAFSKGSGVTVLMETHGDVVKAADIQKVMSQAGNQQQLGLVWDVSNMWAVTGEKPEEVYGTLRKWIRHTHFKDLRKVDGKTQYTLFTEGEVPVFEAIEALRRDGYKGYYSFEWEKLWHPEIAEPEIALARFPVKMKEHFSSVR